MLYFVKKDDLRAEILSRKSQGQTIGLVPTMGALHDGHLSLVNAAKECDVVVVTLFVNPLQFNNPEDLLKYPSDLVNDKIKLSGSCDILFAPGADELYSREPLTKFNFGSLEQNLEGQFRPGHFNGVGVVVSKFLNLIQPDKAYFGLKDLQQYCVIKALVEDLSIPTEIIGCPIVRESNGLAMSSRNERLTENGLSIASSIYKGLQSGKLEFQKGASLALVKSSTLELYNSVDGLEIEYCEVVNQAFELQTEDSGSGDLSLCVAGYVEGVRLIDNLYLRSEN